MYRPQAAANTAETVQVTEKRSTLNITTPQRLFVTEPVDLTIANSAIPEITAPTRETMNSPAMPFFHCLANVASCASTIC
ncbi:hypothetical protein KBX10_10980 [Corynebacterium sp. CCUG 59401]|nr:hypothetical protein [Corynebacterium pseudogenitalium]